MKQQYYISSVDIDKVEEDTDLSAFEIEEIVGRFDKHHWKFAGLLKGQVWKYDSKVQIRHHFTKKILWESRYVF